MTGERSRLNVEAAAFFRSNARLVEYHAHVEPVRDAFGRITAPAAEPVLCRVLAIVDESPPQQAVDVFGDVSSRAPGLRATLKVLACDLTPSVGGSFLIHSGNCAKRFDVIGVKPHERGELFRWDVLLGYA